MTVDENVYLILASVWIILGNIWHGILLLSYKGVTRPLTISEHAVERRATLYVHRLVHSLALLAFVPLAFGYLWPRQYHAAAVFLLMAGIFDCLQTLTLNKQTAALENKLNAHSFSAWLMALGYFCYTASISYIANISGWIYVPVLVSCLVLLICASRELFKRHFLFLQMSYFILLSLAGLYAHWALLIQ